MTRAFKPLQVRAGAVVITNHAVQRVAERFPALQGLSEGRLRAILGNVARKAPESQTQSIVLSTGFLEGSIPGFEGTQDVILAYKRVDGALVITTVLTRQDLNGVGTNAARGMSQAPSTP